MKNHLKRIASYFFLSILFISLSGWGFYVHETATQLAVYKLPKQLQRFFFSHIDSIAANAIKPDKRRSLDKEENPKHFIDIENYGYGAMLTMPRDLQTAIEKYSWDTLKRYGYVPYQIIIEYSLLTNSFKQKNADSILFYADDLAHYIEDATVPLHTTNNYDGQLTGQKGLHALWESTIPQLELNSYNLYSKHKATYVKDKTAATWAAIKRAHALLPEMLAKEHEVSANFADSSKYIESMYYGKKTKVYSDEFAKQYAAALTTTVNDQLNYAADMVADFWYSAWVDAGKPDLKKLYQTSKKNRRQLYKEAKSYRRNELVKNKFIRAKKE